MKPSHDHTLLAVAERLAHLHSNLHITGMKNGKTDTWIGLRVCSFVHSSLQRRANKAFRHIRDCRVPASVRSFAQLPAGLQHCGRCDVTLLRASTQDERLPSLRLQPLLIFVVQTPALLLCSTQNAMHMSTNCEGLMQIMTRIAKQHR